MFLGTFPNEGGIAISLPAKFRNRLKGSCLWSAIYKNMMAFLDNYGINYRWLGFCDKRAFYFIVGTKRLFLHIQMLLVFGASHVRHEAAVWRDRYVRYPLGKMQRVIIPSNTYLHAFLRKIDKMSAIWRKSDI